MFNTDVKIGRIIKISGMKMLIEITEKEIINNIQNIYGNISFPISLNKFVFSYLPNYKKIIGRITEIVDKNFSDDFLNEKNHKDEKYIIKVSLIGIFDEYLDSFDIGVNSFPIIGSEVFALPSYIEKKLFSKKNGNYLEIGKSYNNLEITVKADVDILFGKHLGIFGNTGSGKTCTIVSVIQGLKNDRLKVSTENVNVSPKIIIFDANNEYAKAFNSSKYKYKIIKKEDLKLPHSYLSNTEYYKFLNASGGIQAPIIKEAISNLKEKSNGEHFMFKKLPDAINEIIDKKASNDYNLNQWKNWVGPLLNRIEVIIEDERLYNIIEYDPQKKDTVTEIFEDNDNEVFIIEADFDKDELDIIIFLFSKILYKLKTKKNLENQKNIILLLEEAHRYINEEDKNDYKLGSYYVERLAREGRKFGISLIISSQRPSELSKTVVSQCNSYIIHRLTNKNDLELVNRLLGISYKELLDIVPVLEKQYALVLGEAFTMPDIVKIFDANPLPESHDPKVLESWKI